MKKYSSILFLILFFTTCSKEKRISFEKTFSERIVFQTGVATWYGLTFDGKKSASGEIFDATKLTAAHRKLPFGTLIRVSNTENGKWCIVKINDRGPVSETLLLDLSNAAAVELDIMSKGSAKIEIDILTQEVNAIKRLFDLTRNLGRFKSEKK